MKLLIFGEPAPTILILGASVAHNTFFFTIIEKEQHGALKVSTGWRRLLRDSGRE